MMDLKSCINIAQIVKEVKFAQRMVERNLKERDEAMNKLNELLIANGEHEMNLDEVLSVSLDD